MKIGTFSYDNDEDLFASYKRHSHKKFRSHLVSTRFLLMLIKVMSSDIMINRRILTNIKKFLAIIDRKYYSVDENIEALLLVCDILLAIRFKNSTTGPKLETLIYKIQTSLQEPYDKVRDNLIIPQVNISKDYLPEEDLEYVSQTLDQNLKYDYVYRTKDDLVDLANEMSTCNYNDFPELLLKYRNLLTDIMNFFRGTDSSSRVNDVVHTSEPSFIDFLCDTYEGIKNPSSALQTGWQALNSALGPRGGFQNSCFYLLHANTNSFKSAFLLHIARMISTYNTTRLLEEYKKTGKIPTIVFIEMENDDNEDYERLYKTVCKRDMERCTSREELISSWNHIRNPEDNDENKVPIDISFLHVDSRSMSVEDIDTTIELIEEEGYRVITCIVDYVGLIAPRKDDIGKDHRLQLKNIAEDMLSLAKRRKIPIISAHQLNRSGGAILTNLKMQGGSNAINQMTNEFIGESYGIEQAVSWSAFIDIEIHGEKRYLTFKRNKSRYRNKYGCDTFVMEIHDGIIIEDDIYLDKPLSMDAVPGDLPDNSAMMQQNVGSRGQIDIRTEKHRAPEANHEKLIEPSDTRKPLSTSLINTIEMTDWFMYSQDVGFDNLVCDCGDIDIYDLDARNVTIGETVYVVAGESCGVYDLV